MDTVIAGTRADAALTLAKSGVLKDGPSHTHQEPTDWRWELWDSGIGGPR